MYRHSAMAAELSMRQHDAHIDSPSRGIKLPPTPTSTSTSTSHLRPHSKTLTSGPFPSPSLSISTPRHCASDTHSFLTSFPSPRAVSHTATRPSSSSPHSSHIHPIDRASPRLPDVPRLHSPSTTSVSPAAATTTSAPSLPDVSRRQAHSFSRLPSVPRQSTASSSSSHSFSRLPNVPRRQTSASSFRSFSRLSSVPRRQTSASSFRSFSRLSSVPRRQSSSTSRSFPRLPPRRNTAMANLRRSTTAAPSNSSVLRRSMSFNASAIRRLSTTYARGTSDADKYRIPTLHKSGSSAPPLYLFRAPGVQLRIGLQSESYFAGGTISGTVLIYRDGTAVSTVRDVNVYLVPEIARRKSNNAYEPSQEFDPQNLNTISSKKNNNNNSNRYKYTHTLIPAAQKSWSAGPHEARFHSVTHPFRPVIRGDIPTFSNGDQVTTSVNHQFTLNIPADFPASRTWKEEAKRDAAIDLRYRLVAVVNLSQPECDCTLMAETVVLVANGNNGNTINNNNMGSGAIGMTPSSSTSSYTSSSYTSSRASSTFSSLYGYRKPITMKRMRSGSKHQPLNLSSVELALDKKIYVHCTPPPPRNTHVVLTERVTYMGKVRAERQVTGVESPDDASRYMFLTDGLGESIKEGVLNVSHYINSQRVYIYPSRLGITTDTLSTSSSFKDLFRNTQQLRKQPSIRFYYQDELPLFTNLDYRNRTPAVIPSQRLSALTLASRLPHLTNNNCNHNHNHDNGNSNSDSENEVCCLCLDDLHNQKVTRLRPCGHILHLNCTQLWLRHAAGEGRGAICCPMCKTVLQ